MRSLLVCDAVVAKLCHWSEIVHDMFYFPGEVLIIMQSIDTFVIGCLQPPKTGGFDSSLDSSLFPGIPSGFFEQVDRWVLKHPLIVSI
jgi:hypothetical protein